MDDGSVQETRAEVIQVPAGKPRILIVFKEAESVVASIQKDNNVLPAQQLTIAIFLLIEAVYNFVLSFRQNQRIITGGVGRGN